MATEEPQHLVSHALYGDTNYQSGESCKWNIVAPSGYYVEFKIEHLDIEWEEHCNYDRVMTYDGEIMEQERQLTQTCGDDENHEGHAVSTANALLVIFETDDTLNKKGFSAMFRAIKHGSSEVESNYKTHYGIPQPESEYISFS